HENAGVERAADDHRRVPLDAGGQERVERCLLKQRVSAGEKEDIPVPQSESVHENFPFIDAKADGLDDTGVAKFAQGLVSIVFELLPERLVSLDTGRRNANIVHIENIHAVEAETLQAVLEGAHDAVIAVVVLLIERQRIDPIALILPVWSGRTEQATNLGRNDGARIG